MDTLHAAIVLAKLENFDWEVKERIRIGKIYNESFDKYGVERVHQKSDRTSVFAQYTLMLDDRENFIKHLKSSNIPCAIHYSHPINLSPAYTKYCKGNTPISDNLSKRVISIPMHPYLKSEDQNKIINTVVNF